MRNRNSNRINSTLVAGIAGAALAIVACLVMIFVKNSHYTSKEIVNGLSASFDICESVASVAESMGNALSDDGEEALELAEINAVDFRMTSTAN